MRGSSGRRRGWLEGHAWAAGTIRAVGRIRDEEVAASAVGALPVKSQPMAPFPGLFARDTEGAKAVGLHKLEIPRLHFFRLSGLSSAAKTSDFAARVFIVAKRASRSANRCERASTQVRNAGSFRPNRRANCSPNRLMVFCPSSTICRGGAKHRPRRWLLPCEGVSRVMFKMVHHFAESIGAVGPRRFRMVRLSYARRVEASTVPRTADRTKAMHGRGNDPCGRGNP